MVKISLEEIPEFLNLAENFEIIFDRWKILLMAQKVVFLVFSEKRPRPKSAARCLIGFADADADTDADADAERNTSNSGRKIGDAYFFGAAWFYIIAQKYLRIEILGLCWRPRKLASSRRPLCHVPKNKIGLMTIPSNPQYPQTSKILLYFESDGYTLAIVALWCALLILLLTWESKCTLSYLTIWFYFDYIQNDTFLPNGFTEFHPKI